MNVRPTTKATNLLRVAVVSDLHVFTSAEPGKAPSYLQADEVTKNPRESPLLSLELLIEEQGLNADVLLSPGDLCNRADPQGLQFGWRRTKEIAAKLKAQRVVATVGNHDVDSRHASTTDSWSELKGLAAFPVDEDSLSNEYWARHFTMIADDTAPNYRILSLNSSAHHGQVDIEKNHGRIDQPTLTELQRRLNADPPRSINILLCHHHPQQHSEILLGEDDWMKSGQLLLEVLSKAEYGSWLVIHGHKHHPKLGYAAGGGGSPVVFAAGSLGAHLFAQLGSRTKNQFHLVTVDLDRSRRYGASGWIDSWSFAYGLGWVKPDSALEGLPHVAGFGYRGSPKWLAEQVAALVPNEIVDWGGICESIEDLSYVLPQDFLAMKHHLKFDHKVILLEEDKIIRKAVRQ